MKTINTIEIKYDEHDDEYFFECPYCGHKYCLSDIVGCKHYWFGFESINQQPLDMHQILYDAIYAKLMNHYTKGPIVFSELWINDYRPEYTSSEDYIEEYDSARTDCACYYLESYISMEDVLWFMDRIPQFRDFRSHATIATLEDYEGNDTSFLLLDDEYLTE